MYKTFPQCITGVEQANIIPQITGYSLIGLGSITSLCLMKESCLLLQIIEVKFEKFDVERDNYCRYDHVSIFNGAEINDAKRIGKYCGDSPPA